MLLKRLEKHINFEALKEDLRKVGVNFVTAGAIGLFITRVVHPSLAMGIGSTWVIIMGAIVLFWGIRRRVDK